MKSIKPSNNIFYMILEQTSFAITCDQNTFLTAANVIMESFLSKQPGFVSRELLNIPGTNKYVDCVKWETLDQAHTAMQIAMTDTSPEVGGFMQCIDPQSVKEEYYESVK